MTDNKLVKAEIRKLSEFSALKHNPNKHTPRGLKMLETAMSEVGYVAPLTVAADGESLDGAARLETAGGKFGDEAIVIEHDGTRPVVMVRTDIPNTKTDIAKKIIVGANRIAEVDLDWDIDILNELAVAGDIDLSDFWKEDELEELKLDNDGQGNAGNVGYNRGIEAPIYIPKGPKPSISDLYDNSRTVGLIHEIESSELPDDEKEFLKIAAGRHTILNYKRIAEYYAHSDKDAQELIENSALVIIDFKRAIELGYVRLSKEVAQQYAEDYEDHEVNSDE